MADDTLPLCQRRTDQKSVGNALGWGSHNAPRGAPGMDRHDPARAHFFASQCAISRSIASRYPSMPCPAMVAMQAARM